MAGGTPDRASLVSPEQIARMAAPHTVEEVPAENAEAHNAHFRAYGLGWQVDDFDGYRRVFHGGNNIGFMSYVAMIPELHLGLVVLSNRQERYTTVSIATYLTKLFTGGRQRDWTSVFGSLEKTEELASARWRSRLAMWRRRRD
jgi:CubicO group peptidase (beta-lactamase class C family)